MKFEGLAVVHPAKSDSNPDAYLVIGDDSRCPVIRVGSKRDIGSLQKMADALNRWAGKKGN
jgi:hypothetical protein